MDHYLPYQGLRRDTHTHTHIYTVEASHVQTLVISLSVRVSCVCVSVCVYTDPLTHFAGLEPLCRGMLMFSKETITQQREIETERLTERERATDG